MLNEVNASLVIQIDTADWAHEYDIDPAEALEDIRDAAVAATQTYLVSLGFVNATVRKV